MYQHVLKFHDEAGRKAGLLRSKIYRCLYDVRLPIPALQNIYRSNGWLHFWKMSPRRIISNVTQGPVSSTHLRWEYFGEKQNEVLLALCPQHGRQMLQNVGVSLATEGSQDDAEGFCTARHFNCIPGGRPCLGSGEIKKRAVAENGYIRRVPGQNRVP